jgi:hypothetical protein
MKRFSVAVIAFGLLLGASTQAQQKPSAAEEKAGQQRLVRQAAEQAAAEAEAAARARQKVAEEARSRDLAAAREAEAKVNAITPLDVEVVISRYLNNKLLSALPYSLAVSAGERVEKTSLRMGANVPIPTTTFTQGAAGDGKPAPNPLVSYNYQNVGTDIDCAARALGDGRFVLNITVGERSVAQSASGSGAVAGAPIIRTFNASNNLVLRDGQTRQFTAASDRVTGEVVKVDVTLKVAK